VKRFAVPYMVGLHSKLLSVETIVTKFLTVWTINVGILMLNWLIMFRLCTSDHCNTSCHDVQCVVAR
jgi:hypothetical protein